jgi:cytochrome c556
MRRMHVLAGIAALLAVGALAQTDSEFQGLMKNNPANMGSLNRNIAGKEFFGAAADAQKLAATFKQVEDYWRKRGGAEDAVNFAITAQTAASAAAKAATDGNLDEAAAQVKILQGACAGCHMAHRDGAPGAFKIK